MISPTDKKAAAEPVVDALSYLKLSAKPGSPQAILDAYLLRDALPARSSLTPLPLQTALNPLADAHFAEQRKRADEADSVQNVGFHNMAVKVAREMQEKTSALTIPESLMPDCPAMVLDLCMAPGGYSFVAMEVNKGAKVRAITLSMDKGGHDVVIPVDGETVVCEYADITMYAAVMDVGKEDIPAGHPDAENFRYNKPFEGEKFDLVFCDGQVLRTQERQSYREQYEAIRLLTSQLVIAFQRMREGATMICLLHRVEDWTTTQLLYTMSKVADVELFKPEYTWGKRGSFYLVAKNVRPDCEAAERAVKGWMDAWRKATFNPLTVTEGKEAAGDEDETKDGTLENEKLEDEKLKGEKLEDGKLVTMKAMVVKVEDQKTKVSNAEGEKPKEETNHDGADVHEMEVYLSADTVEDLLRDYGETLVSMGRGVWQIQHAAMLRAPWNKQQRQTTPGWFESPFRNPEQRQSPTGHYTPFRNQEQRASESGVATEQPRWKTAKSWRRSEPV
ncbi:hypothetical protein GE09DRAFT_1059878 [Coniochaeta sp. 2T2.1]|nr:hypothetical protein GE09DRAFT_1059878 [Coniochaeta sp. 2T2.1]